ncbi:hypothetical protein NA57DRAFT_78995 [Rhizodiscina lignyota]|uniref:Uncharacterized protein n=1 Tax=Rhizodiscina lignyota TaxID=1504668 RepID=A0A9P4ICW7_9PEZI|nr:hypothetical protein NA57DRAFT_78995 [Rhizodiscina lignyota]
MERPSNPNSDKSKQRQPHFHELLPTNSEEGLEAEATLSEDQIQQESVRLEQTLEWIPSPPSNTRERKATAVRLERPVAIPRVDIAHRLRFPLSFLRAYSPVLETHDVGEPEFLAFLDNLSVVQASSPPFHALNMAGMVVGFAPEITAMTIGTGMQVVAGAGMMAVAAVRTRRFLQRSNSEYFAPRGLKVSIKKDQDLADLVGFPTSGRAIMPIDIKLNRISLRDRRMAALASYTAPLDTDVPSPTSQRSALDKISETQLKWKAERREKVLLKKKKQLDEREERIARMRKDATGSEAGAAFDHEGYLDGGASTDSDFESDSSIESLEDDLQKLEEKVEKINLQAQVELEIGKAEADKIEQKRQTRLQKNAAAKSDLETKLDKKVDQMSKKGRQTQMKKEKRARRMEYVVVENLN